MIQVTDRIESANTVKELSSLQIELQSYRVLDPACGSGNFLYIAYQEFSQQLQESIAQADRGETISWNDAKLKLGL